jgi:N-methylhydantoinase B
MNVDALPRAAAVDGATAEVIHNYLLAAAEEMRTTLRRTAFTPTIYEALDFGISIYNADRELVAEAPGLSLFLGANDYSIRKVMDYFGPQNLLPGDIILSNYPYWNGAHTYDATLLAPVFDPADRRLFGYLCIRCHWSDLGGKDPGYILDSTDMHQEGIVFPGTPVYRNGEPVEEIIEIIRFNSRRPHLVLGDLHAQVAAIRSGERRLHELLGKFGRAKVDTAIAVLFEHGERSVAQALAALPKGNWTATDILDDDGISDDSIAMQVTVTITDQTFTVDFTGSGPATRGPVNMPFGATTAVAKMVFKSLTTPHRPANAGQMRALHVKAEPGTLFHAVYPAPTFTLWTGFSAVELLYKAIAQAIPERAAAGSGGDVPGFMMIGVHPDSGLMFGVSNDEPVGRGGAAGHDGANALVHISACVVRMTPTEVMETRSTMLMERIELRPDSGGAGRYRGGLGLDRHIRFLTPGEFLTLSKRSKSPPWALAGGRESRPTEIIAFPGTERQRLMRTHRVPVQAGDRIIVRSAGGAGYGPPSERDVGTIRTDLDEGYVTPEGARRDYGFSAK